MGRRAGAAGLRIGVICRGSTVAAWHARALEALRAVPGVDPVAVVVDPVSASSPAGLHAALARYVERRSRALRPVDITEEMAGIQQVRAASDDEGLGTIGSLGLDVLIDLSREDAPPDLVRGARRGVWSLHFGSPPNGSSGVEPGFWEILHREAVMTVELRCRIEARSAAAAIDRAFFRTHSHSYVHTVDDALFGAAELPARACRSVLAGAERAPLPGAVANPAATAAPSNRDLLAFSARMATNFVRTQFTAVAFSPQWNVGVVNAPIHRFLDASFEPRVQWIPKAPRARFVADPFGVPDGSEPQWLVEAYDYATNRGVITAVDPRNPSARADSVLAVDTHASYPYLIRHRGDVYCVPQLEDSNGIRIFRAVRYPKEWEAAGVLVPDVAARDTTLFEHDGRWWLTFADAAAPVTDLHVWFADDLFGPWHPHAANPVKIDARSARPAGTPFVHAGALYRPAQDCSRSYGGGVAICRVDVLTPTAFREEVVRVLRAMPSYRGGTHTLAAVGDATLVDGKRFVFTPAGTRRALRSRLQRAPS